MLLSAFYISADAHVFGDGTSPALRLLLFLYIHTPWTEPRYYYCHRRPGIPMIYLYEASGSAREEKAACMQMKNNVRMLYSRVQTILHRRRKQKQALEIVRAAAALIRRRHGNRLTLIAVCPVQPQAGARHPAGRLRRRVCSRQHPPPSREPADKTVGSASSARRLPRAASASLRPCRRAPARPPSTATRSRGRAIRTSPSPPPGRSGEGLATQTNGSCRGPHGDGGV